MVMTKDKDKSTINLRLTLPSGRLIDTVAINTGDNVELLKKRIVSTSNCHWLLYMADVFQRLEFGRLDNESLFPKMIP